MNKIDQAIEIMPTLLFPNDICDTLVKGIKGCQFSREQIVDRINQCLNDTEKITLNNLNKWTAKSQISDFPAHLAPAFCWAVKSDELYQLWADAFELEIISNVNLNILKSVKNCPFCDSHNLEIKENNICCKQCTGQAPIDNWNIRTT